MHRRESQIRNNNEDSKNEVKVENSVPKQEEEDFEKKKLSITYSVKLLLSGQTSWSISSRNEPKVGWMNEKFGSDVRLSRSDDFYPGTRYRICLINGNIDQIKDSLDWILNLGHDSDTKESQQQIRLLVPKTSLGTLINRGYGIKSLCEREKVEIHIPEHNESILREVTATITGQQNNIINACIAIAKVIKGDTFSQICRNISYEEFNTYLRRKEQLNSMPNFINIPVQQSVIKNNWVQQHVTYPQQQMQQYPRNKQYPMQRQQAYQQAPNFYYNQNSQYQEQHHPHHHHQQQQQQQHQQQEKPLILQQQEQINQLQLQLPQQILQKPQEEELPTTASNEETKTSPKNVENTFNSPTTVTSSTEGTAANETGSPIPSVTSFWRRASSDNWRFSNNRESNNGQSNVEVIPGFN